MRYLIILFLVYTTFSYSQENDKYIKVLINDTIFLNKLRYADCDTVNIIDKTNSIAIKTAQNYNNQFFEFKKFFSEDENDPFKYHKGKYSRILNDQRTKLVNCSSFFIEKISKKGKITTVKYYCPQKDLLGEIKFKCNRNKITIVNRQMGNL